jgi:hypothetical protein
MPACRLPSMLDIGTSQNWAAMPKIGWFKGGPQVGYRGLAEIDAGRRHRSLPVGRATGSALPAQPVVPNWRLTTTPYTRRAPAPRRLPPPPTGQVFPPGQAGQTLRKAASCPAIAARPETVRLMFIGLPDNSDCHSPICLIPHDSAGIYTVMTRHAINCLFGRHSK